MARIREMEEAENERMKAEAQVRQASRPSVVVETSYSQRSSRTGQVRPYLHTSSLASRAACQKLTRVQQKPGAFHYSGSTADSGRRIIVGGSLNALQALPR